MSKTTTYVITSALAAGLMAASPLYAAQAGKDDVTALKAEIAALQAKVDALEKQTPDKGSSAVGSQAPVIHAAVASPVVDEDYLDPFEQMAALDRQMQMMMAQPAGFGFRQPMMRGHMASFSPDYDVKSTDKAYVISFDMPGMDKSKINVEVKNGVILVSGERASETKEDQGGKFYRQERSFGYFSRSIPLPEDAKAETVQAKYDNGVLSITIDKKDAVKKAAPQQKIEVK